MNDFLKNFNDRAGDQIKAFGNSIPLTQNQCRKEALGKDFPCKCEKCEEKKYGNT